MPGDEKTQEKGYVKLVFKNRSHVVNDITTYLGRNHKDAPSNFVPVGTPQSKSISRKHAILAWNKIKKTWELTVKGKNALEMDDVRYEKDTVITLRHKAKITLADDVFYVLFPLNAVV